MIQSPKIVIAGASGYIGSALLLKLLDKFPNAEIVALSRSARVSDHPRITWKACELFSLKSLEAAIPKKVDLAFYMVHSMGPTAHLDQGSFADYDLILAENFAKVLKSVGLSQLIYLGGLIPNSKTLSLHLQSRLEVEQTFQQSNLPTTVFRAGLIIGDSGSSFQILSKLVRRLPIMICPAWTQTLTTPVDLQTVIHSIVESALDESRVGKIFDLAGCESLTYVEMMRETARRMGKRRYFIAVPFFTPTLSRLWVSLITTTSKELVYPLISSLEHPMVARQDHLFAPFPKSRTYFSLLQDVTMIPKRQESAKSQTRFRAQRKTVRSVQRLPLPAGRNAEWVKDQYLLWLPKFLAPFIKVGVDRNRVRFSFLFKKIVMLELLLNEERSDPDRQLLYIEGGWLTAVDKKGRLEFRVVLNRQFIIAAIHDYKPSLPWFIYQNTQAIVHLWVMKSFARYLGKKKN